MRNCRLGTIRTYNISSDKSTRAQHVDPQAQKAGQFLAWQVVEGIVEHGFEAIEAREHGEEERIEVASHAVAVLGTKQLGRGIVGLD